MMEEDSLHKAADLSATKSTVTGPGGEEDENFDSSGATAPLFQAEEEMDGEEEEEEEATKETTTDKELDLLQLQNMQQQLRLYQNNATSNNQPIKQKPDLLVLVSLYGQAANREAFSQQEHALTILKGLDKNLVGSVRLLDASSEENVDKRDALLGLSSSLLSRENVNDEDGNDAAMISYPQFFLVQPKLKSQTNDSQSKLENENETELEEEEDMMENNNENNRSFCIESNNAEMSVDEFMEQFDKVQYFGDYKDLFAANERGTLRQSLIYQLPIYQNITTTEMDDDKEDSEQEKGDEKDPLLERPSKETMTRALEDAPVTDDEQQDKEHELTGGENVLEADTVEPKENPVISFSADDNYPIYSNKKELGRDEQETITAKTELSKIGDAMQNRDEHTHTTTTQYVTCPTTAEAKTAEISIGIPTENLDLEAKESPEPFAESNTAPTAGQETYDSIRTAEKENDDDEEDVLIKSIENGFEEMGEDVNASVVINATTSEVPNDVASCVNDDKHNGSESLEQHTPPSTVSAASSLSPPAAEATASIARDKISRETEQQQASVINKVKKDRALFGPLEIPEWVDTWMILPTNPVVKMAESRTQRVTEDKKIETTIQVTLYYLNGEQRTQKHLFFSEPTNRIPRVVNPNEE